MRTVTFHEEADVEVNEAARYYEASAPGLACCFWPRSQRRLNRCWATPRHSKSSATKSDTSSSGVSHTVFCTSLSRIGFGSLRLLTKEAPAWILESSAVRGRREGRTTRCRGPAAERERSAHTD